MCTQDELARWLARSCEEGVHGREEQKDCNSMISVLLAAMEAEGKLATILSECDERFAGLGIDATDQLRVRIRDILCDYYTISLCPSGNA